MLGRREEDFRVTDWHEEGPVEPAGSYVGFLLAWEPRWGLCWRPSLRRKVNDKSDMSRHPGPSGLLSGCNGNRKIPLEACRGVWPLLFKDGWGQRAEKQQLVKHCRTGEAKQTCRENGGCSVCARAYLRVLNVNYWHPKPKNGSQKQHSALWVSVLWYLKVTISQK